MISMYIEKLSYLYYVLKADILVSESVQKEKGTGGDFYVSKNQKII